MKQLSSNNSKAITNTASSKLHATSRFPSRQGRRLDPPDRERDPAPCPLSSPTEKGESWIRNPTKFRILSTLH